MVISGMCICVAQGGRHGRLPLMNRAMTSAMKRHRAPIDAGIGRAASHASHVGDRAVEDRAVEDRAVL